MSWSKEQVALTLLLWTGQDMRDLSGIVAGDIKYRLIIMWLSIKLIHTDPVHQAGMEHLTQREKTVHCRLKSGRI